MYAVSKFAEERPALLRDLIESNPLGALITYGAEGLAADHLPFELGTPTADAPHGVLRAHVARNNPVWRRGGADALVLFQGLSAYITPSMYEEKAIDGKVVPTWNYVAVHAQGSLHVMEDPADLFALLERMSAHHEGGRQMPWSIHDAPRDFIDKLMKAIVGIEIPITRIQGKWKLSQDEVASNQERIAASDPLMARFMRERAA